MYVGMVVMFHSRICGNHYKTVSKTRWHRRGRLPADGTADWVRKCRTISPICIRIKHTSVQESEDWI